MTCLNKIVEFLDEVGDNIGLDTTQLERPHGTRRHEDSMRSQGHLIWRVAKSSQHQLTYLANQWEPFHMSIFPIIIINDTNLK